MSNCSVWSTALWRVTVLVLFFMVFWLIGTQSRYNGQQCETIHGGSYATWIENGRQLTCWEAKQAFKASMDKVIIGGWVLCVIASLCVLVVGGCRVCTALQKLHDEHKQHELENRLKRLDKRNGTESQQPAFKV